uniref:Integrase, catalytic region, zinc finger, CCHC-type, peptidase aspartic, catalytic n=1 Tax=Tanacetum cinerariifolium TaxID=118510 RepID=A0A699KEI0_TANCI|nr:hypothetical protein [Tanacetum cinerariifolium]
MELECAKVRGDLLSNKMEYKRSSEKYTHIINGLNQTVLELKEKLSAQQDTISILKQQKDAQIKLYKTREDKEIEKVIDLENKVKVLDNIVYKTGQSVQTMNMLNNKCRTSFAKPEYLKKAKQANPRLYDIDSLTSQLETQKTQFVNEIDRLSREYYYADHMNAILGYFEIQDLKAQLQDKGIAIRVIPTTSVSRPQLKSNPQGDRVLRSNSRGKKLEVDEHRRSVKLLKNCNCMKTVASESIKKPRNNVRKLNESFGKIYKWSYIKFTPAGYMWKPKSTKENVNLNVSMPLANASRTANVKDTMTSRHSIVSNTPLSSNSFAAHRDYSIHRQLWVLKAHDGKSQASN